METQGWMRKRRAKGEKERFDKMFVKENLLL
jgi:hypothetical protein